MYLYVLKETGRICSESLREVPVAAITLSTKIHPRLPLPLPQFFLPGHHPLPLLPTTALIGHHHRTIMLYISRAQHQTPRSRPSLPTITPHHHHAQSRGGMHAAQGLALDSTQRLQELALPVVNKPQVVASTLSWISSAFPAPPRPCPIRSKYSPSCYKTGTHYSVAMGSSTVLLL